MVLQFIVICAIMTPMVFGGFTVSVALGLALLCAALGLCVMSWLDQKGIMPEKIGC